MSKLSNMLNMFLLLESGRKYTAKELAEKLEVSERMIRTYRDELEIAGIYIDSIKGKYGGYVLNEELTDINIGLSKSDVAILEMVEEIVQKDKTFKFKKDYDLILQKVKKMYENSKQYNGTKYYGSLDSEKNIEKKYDFFKNAIKTKQKVRIWYVSFTTKIRQRIIHPIHLIKYKNSWFVIAFCETKGELRQFKFDRITKYELLEEIFETKNIVVE